MSDNQLTSPEPSDADLAAGAPFRMTSRQAASIIASTIIGIGVLTLPRTTTEGAAQNGWISSLLGAIIAMIGISLIYALARRHPGQTIVTYVSLLLAPRGSKLAGLIIGLPVFLVFIVYWVGSTASVARVFGEVVTATILKRTPLEVIIITMLLTAFVLVLHDIEVVTRVNEVLLPIIVVPILAIGISSLQSAKIVNMLPLFQISPMQLVKGVLMTSISYLGFEVMTVFYAYTRPGKNSLLLHSCVGIAIPGLVYSLIVFSGIAVFGVDELRLLAWPTLELVKTTAVPGLILERLESAFLGVWVAAVFTTLANMYFASSLMLKEIFRLKSHRWIALLLLPIFYWLSLIPENIQVLFNLETILGYVGSAAALGIPFLLLLLSLSRKNPPHRDQNESSAQAGSREE